MSTAEIATPVSTRQQASGTERAKFLRKVLRESGWRIKARADAGWNLVFERTIRGKIGQPDIDVVVVMEDKVSIQGRFGQGKSFHDAESVYVPSPTMLHLSYASVQTVAKMLLDGCCLYISSSYGSTNSSKHGLSFMSLECRLKGIDDTIQIGHQSVFVHGRMVICGSVE